MTRATLLIWLMAAALALAMAGCGDDGGTTTVTATQNASGDEVVIEAEEGAFDPHAIYDKAAPGVVTVISTFDSSGAGGLLGGGPLGGQGSGFVVTDDGQIVTNAHVVTDAESSGASGPLHEADEVYVQFSDRNRVPAEVLGFDPFADVALLKVDPEGLDLVPLAFDDSSQVRVGDAVAAIGSPFGQEQSLSVGVISATDRSIQSLTRYQIDAALQTDASINPGNSGGPLLDAEGRVIGVNQQINTSSGSDAGVGFAVPSNLVASSLEGLQEDGEPDYAYLGVTSQALYPQLADHLGIDADSGSLIAAVQPGSPADDAGLEGGDDRIRFQGTPVRTGGDVILSVDGERVVGAADLPKLISEHAPGDIVTLEVLRDGELDEVEVELEPRPTA